MSWNLLFGRASISLADKYPNAYFIQYSCLLLEITIVNQLFLFTITAKVHFLRPKLYQV